MGEKVGKLVANGGQRKEGRDICIIQREKKEKGFEN